MFGIDDLAGALVKVVTGAAKPILDKFVGDKMSDGDRAKMDLELQKSIVEGVQKEKDTFYKFVIEHTGAAKDMPRFIQILRGTVRPVLTYASFAAFIWIAKYVFDNMSMLTDPNQIAVVREIQITIKAILIIVLAFWFGDRLLTRTGIVDILMRRKNGS